MDSISSIEGPEMRREDNSGSYTQLEMRFYDEQAERRDDNRRKDKAETETTLLTDQLRADSDIPPWHQSTKEKPAWLLRLLSQAAEQEDASDVYQRYRSRSVRHAPRGTSTKTDEMVASWRRVGH
jgi:hypothetical protein